MGETGGGDVSHLTPEDAEFIDHREIEVDAFLHLMGDPALTPCGVDRATVGRWVKAGKVKAWRTPGGQYRIPESEVERLRGGH